MPTYVFDLCNIYVPEGSVYENDELNIQIEPRENAEEFEELRRNSESEYQHGYWNTAQCYIEAEQDRAEQLADWLTFIYSFAQNRDVTWFNYSSLEQGEHYQSRRSTYTFSMDNTSLPLIKGMWGPPGDQGLDGFVDTALQTLDEGSEAEQSRLLRSLSLFLEAQGDTFWMIKFLLQWIVLESNANYNYDDYLQGPGESIFTDDEIEVLSDSVINHLEANGWEPNQVAHMEYILGQKHLYGASSKTKIKIYLDYLNIGFDIEEIEDIIQMARSIRNPIAHRNDDARLMNNAHIVNDIRKIDFYVLLRLLGVDETMQNRLITPIISGPDIDRE
ncbi:hypothetical protein [Halorussus halophilus]|uniref:hypothetical protein n=1 Tax=Halorussus halophilus TaxID=2650975 RepID=UPI001300F273|nr:hypothetical protein [Halorussus halophilus]